VSGAGKLPDYVELGRMYRNSYPASFGTHRYYDELLSPIIDEHRPAGVSLQALKYELAVRWIVTGATPWQRVQLAWRIVWGR
jgi:hypothetical protein